MNKGSETGLQDLLFNGAVGCLLLFIIFAVKTNGNAIVEAVASREQVGKFQSTSSLPVDNEKVAGQMIAHRRVIIRNLKSDEREPLLSSRHWKWNYSGTQGYVAQYIQMENDNIILGIAFTSHPQDLVLEFDSTTPGIVQLTACAVEGSLNALHRVGAQHDFPGYCAIDLTQTGFTPLAGMKVTFAVGNIINCDLSSIVTLRN